MLEVLQTRQGKTLILELRGSLDETVAFDAWLPEKEMRSLDEVQIRCKLVSRINSTGTRAWMKLLDKLRRAGVRIKLVDCSPAIVSHINLINGFITGAQIESIQLPYACVDCNRELNLTVTVKSLKSQGQPHAPSCPSCNQGLEFNDSPEEYFEFLARCA